MGDIMDITTEEGKQEFAAALAVRQKELKKECERTMLSFIKLDVSIVLPEDFDASRNLSEKNYENWVEHAKAIVDLPLDIKQEFGKEYARIAI